MRRISEGDAVPEGPLMRLVDGLPVTVNSRTLLDRGRHIVIGAMAAFTPGCGPEHVAPYIRMAEPMKATGKVDALHCICVTDPYVMAAWGRTLEAGSHLSMIADPNGAFAGACGLLIDLSHLGMGMRSCRYTMITDRGRVERITIMDDADKALGNPGLRVRDKAF